MVGRFRPPAVSVKIKAPVSRPHSVHTDIFDTVSEEGAVQKHGDHLDRDRNEQTDNRDPNHFSHLSFIFSTPL